MLFSNNKLAKKHLAFALLLLIILTAVPLLTVQASVDLLYFRAAAGSDSIKVEWETAQELDNLGFNLYRGLSDDFEAATKLNGGLIAGNTGSATGAYYDWLDTDVQVGTQYTYWLIDIDINGVETTHGPITSSPTGGSGFPTTVPSNNSTATPTPTKTPTRTPTATTQSGTAATQTPTRTPIPSPTTASSNANPTATTASQVQATSASNNSTTTQVQSNPTERAATVQPDANSPAEPVEPTAETTAPETEATPEAVAQALNGGDQDPSDGVTAPSIGQGGQNNTQETVEGRVDGESDRSPVVLMAFIISVILLFVGGGGIVALLINRNKANEDLSG